MFYEYTYLLLVTYSVHMVNFMVNSVHIPPYVDLNSISTTSCLVCTLRNFTAYFVYLLFLCELIFIWVIFYGMFLCWPILYIYILMVTYFLYKENFNVLFCKHTSSFFMYFTTCSWPRLYTGDFHGLFCLFSSPWWAYIERYLWLRARTSSWSPLLYIRNFLMALSLHIPPNVYLFFISTNSSWLSL